MLRYLIGLMLGILAHEVTPDPIVITAVRQAPLTIRAQRQPPLVISARRQEPAEIHTAVRVFY